MKVLLTGSIGVGKTTLFKALPEGDGIHKIPEAARSILQTAPDLRLNPYFQRALLLEQYFQETEAEKRDLSLIICDRGYVDVVAYSRYFGLQADQELVRAFKPYDHIFYCDPWGTPPLPEGIPGVTPSETEKTDVDVSIRETLDELGIPWHTLRGPTEERLETFYQIMREVLEIRRTIEGQPSRKEQ